MGESQLRFRKLILGKVVSATRLGTLLQAIIVELELLHNHLQVFGQSVEITHRQRDLIRAIGCFACYTRNRLHNIVNLYAGTYR